MPPPARRTPAAVARLLASNFPHSKFLGAKASGTLLSELHALGIAGGAVYDALVGAVAKEHGLALATRDERALETYRALDSASNWCDSERRLGRDVAPSRLRTDLPVRERARRRD